MVTGNPVYDLYRVNFLKPGIKIDKISYELFPDK